MISIYCFTKKNIHEAGALPPSSVTHSHFSQFCPICTLNNIAGHSKSGELKSRGVMEISAGKGGGRRNASEFHNFPLHDNDAEFPIDEMYETNYL